MKRTLFISLIVLGVLVISGCTRDATAEEDAVTSEQTMAEEISLEWSDPNILTIRAAGFNPGETILIAVDLTYQESSSRGTGGNSRQVSQQSQQQLTTTTTADAAGVVTHDISVSTPSGTSVSVAITDQAGNTRSAAATAP